MFKFWHSVGGLLSTAVALGLAAALGRNGRQFFRDNYDWPVIERKYLEMFDRLKKELPPQGGGGMEPLPGFFARRRRNLDLRARCGGRERSSGQ